MHTACAAESCSFINGVTCYTAHLCTWPHLQRGVCVCGGCGGCGGGEAGSCACLSILPQYAALAAYVHGCVSKVRLLSHWRRCISACINACIIACVPLRCLHAWLFSVAACFLGSPVTWPLLRNTRGGKWWHRTSLGFFCNFPTCTWEKLQLWVLFRVGVKGHRIFFIFFIRICLPHSAKLDTGSTLWCSCLSPNRGTTKNSVAFYFNPFLEQFLTDACWTVWCSITSHHDYYVIVWCEIFSNILGELLILWVIL